MLRVENLKTYFPVRGGVFLTAKAQCKAVDDVSIHIGSGETLGLVGESGCGKSTLGKTIVRLIKPTDGRILFDGADLAGLSERALKPHRLQQMSHPAASHTLHRSPCREALLTFATVRHRHLDPCVRRMRMGRPRATAS